MTLNNPGLDQGRDQGRDKSLETFWTFLNPNEKFDYELRIMDYNVCKQLNKLYNVPYYSGGVFVNKYTDILKIIKFCKDKCNIWIGVNSRKKSYDESLRFTTFGGKDKNVYGLHNIFLDIDRTENNKQPASLDQKRNIKTFVDLIITNLNVNGITNYCRIDSGNGEQLLIPLDEVIVLPDVDTSSSMFDNYKQLIKKVFIDKLITKFNTKENRKLYGCEIDKSCGNIGRVCSIPKSFNIKYKEKFNIVQQRNVIEYGFDCNKGLSDSLLKELDNLSLPVFNKNVIGKPLHLEFVFKSDTVKDSDLVKFILSKDLKPNTGINNVLIFQFKCLCKDNDIDINLPEILEIKKNFEKKFNRSFAWNVPEKNFHFNPNTVNNYCIENMFYPLYSVFHDVPVINKFNHHIFCYTNYVAYKQSRQSEVVIIDFLNVSDLMFKLQKCWNGSIEMLYDYVIMLESKYGEIYTTWFFETVFKLYVEKLYPVTRIDEYLQNKKNGLNGFSLKQ